MASGLPQQQLNSLIRRQYTNWQTGNGAKTEFILPKDVARLDDLLVCVAGLVKRPSDQGTAYDYKVRGITPGYSGQRNAVTFTVAPAAGAAIGFIQLAN